MEKSGQCNCLACLQLSGRYCKCDIIVTEQLKSQLCIVHKNGSQLLLTKSHYKNTALKGGRLGMGVNGTTLSMLEIAGHDSCCLNACSP